MAETRQDATIYRGTDNALVFTVADDADLAGEELVYTVARHPAGVAALVIERSAITHEGNEATVPIGDADSRALAPGVWFHELYTIEEGTRLVLATGRLVVLPAQIARHEADEEEA